MRSHFLHMLLYATLVSSFFAVLLRRRWTDQLRLGATIWLAMIAGSLALAYLMYPFPR